MLRAFHFRVVCELEKKLPTLCTFTTCIDRHHAEALVGKVSKETSKKMLAQMLRLCGNALGVKGVVKDKGVMGTCCDVNLIGTKLGCDVIMALCSPQDLAGKQAAATHNEDLYQRALYCWRFISV